MLEFRKNDVDDMKLLPTIDFTDPDSLKGNSIHFYPMPFSTAILSSTMNLIFASPRYVMMIK